MSCIRDLTDEEYDALPPLPPCSLLFWFSPWGPPEQFMPYSDRVEIAAFEEWFTNVRRDSGAREFDLPSSYVKQRDEARLHWPDCEYVWITQVEFSRSIPPGGSSPPPVSSQAASIIKFFDMRARGGNGDGRHKLYSLAA